MRRLVEIFVITLVMLLVGVGTVFASSAQAHDGPIDSVQRTDNGQAYLVFNENFGAAAEDKWLPILKHAVDAWRELNHHGGTTGVVLLNANNTTLPTTVNVELYCLDDNRLGFYDAYFEGEDYIWINRCELQPFGDFQKKKTMTHEFGHALDFEHPPDTAYYRDNSIMWVPTADNTGFAVPREHDHNDYHARWVN